MPVVSSDVFIFTLSTVDQLKELGDRYFKGNNHRRAINVISYAFQTLRLCD
jgi:hypothetical protein